MKTHATRRMWANRSKLALTTMKNFATRRLWVKRSKKSWTALVWLAHKTVLLPFKLVIGLVVWVYEIWCECGTLLTLVLLLACCGLGAIAWNTFYQVGIASKIASPERILEVRRADPCQDNTLVRRAAQKNAPLLVRDLDLVVSDCKKYWQNLEEQKKQDQAIKKQLEALK